MNLILINEKEKEIDKYEVTLNYKEYQSRDNILALKKLIDEGTLIPNNFKLDAPDIINEPIVPRGIWFQENDNEPEPDGKFIQLFQEYKSVIVIIMMIILLLSAITFIQTHQHDKLPPYPKDTIQQIN